VWPVRELGREPQRVEPDNQRLVDSGTDPTKGRKAGHRRSRDRDRCSERPELTPIAVDAVAGDGVCRRVCGALRGQFPLEMANLLVVVSVR